MLKRPRSCARWPSSRRAKSATEGEPVVSNNASQTVDSADYDECAEAALRERSASHYRAAAARARKLEADSTTPRIKQHLRKLIDWWERLAEEIDGASENG